MQATHEILRVCARQNGPQDIELDPDFWDDPAAWGLLLMDLARHAAKAYEMSGHQTYEQTLQRILEGFDLERENPTDSV